MSDILIRGVDRRALARLRARAKRHGRSLQSEARHVLEQAAGAGPEAVEEMFARWQKRFAGRRFTSSVRGIRRDRER